MKATRKLLRAAFIYLFPQGTDQPDKLGSRTIMHRNFGITLQIRQNSFGKLFTELNAPLVKWIDVPDNPLDKYFVLIEGHKLPQHFRRQFRK